MVTDIAVTWNANGRCGAALLYNISIGGCMIETADDPFFPGDIMALSLPNLAAMSGSVVWQVGRHAGIRFHHPLDAATVEDLGFKEPLASFDQMLPRDRFGRPLPILSGQLPF